MATIKIDYTLFNNINELSKADQQLVKAALHGITKSYAPYSNFYVGAAVLLENQEIITAGNQENGAYPMCLCAERTALATASSMFQGQKVVSLAVAVKTDNKNFTGLASPCGACRQVMHEVATAQKREFPVFLLNQNGKILKLNSSFDLLPFAFNTDF